MEVGLLKDETKRRNSLQDNTSADPRFFFRACLRKTFRVDMKTDGKTEKYKKTG